VYKKGPTQNYDPRRKSYQPWRTSSWVEEKDMTSKL